MRTLRSRCGKVKVRVFMAASATSAVSSTITGALPPSSKAIGFLPTLFFSSHPTGALPVNETIATRSSLMMLCMFSTSVGTIWRALVGNPLCKNTSPSNSDVSGVRGLGLMMIELPEARAGATLCATRLSGKLKGVMP